MDRWETMYRAHVGTVYRYAISRARRHDVAEDITSDVFLALRAHLDDIDPSQLPGWLLTVARHRARDYWRRETVRRRYADQVLRTPPIEATPPASPARLWPDMDAPLRPLHRECLRLRYVYGMSRAEIAATLRIKELQVKSALQYALQLLRDSAGNRSRAL